MASTMPANHAPGLPLMQDEPRPAGFTAVNGDARRTETHVSAEPGAPFTYPVEDGDAAVQASWRPAERHNSGDEEAAAQPDKRPGTIDEATTGTKRKRTPSQERTGMQLDTGSTGIHDVDSPKRRHLQTTTDSAIDLTSPSNEIPTATMRRDTTSEGPNTTTQERAQSPGPRRNPKEPPPRPSRETEASLAESLRKFQQAEEARVSESVLRERSNQQVQSGPVEEIDSPEDDQDGPDEPEQSEVTNADLFDPKKRKRNFSNRTKTGCHTCRERKKKCDEAKPFCNNCVRGNFPCRGYGPKQPGHKIPPQAQVRVMPLQSKGPYEAPTVPHGYWSQPPSAHPLSQAPPLNAHDDTFPYGPRAHNNCTAYDAPRLQWEHPLPRPASQDRRDGWGRTAYPYPESMPLNHQPQPFHSDRLPPSSLQPLPTPGPSYPSERPPPPVQPPWPPVMPSQQPAGPPPPASSKGSAGSGGSQRTSQLMARASGKFDQKEQMLSGKPYQHWLDNTLLEERASCQAALLKYNQAAENPAKYKLNDRAQMFKSILDPTSGTYPRNADHTGPKGSIKERVVVESPFRCDYGYHLHFGEEITVQPGCYFQDAGGIYIGNGVMIGPNVQLLTMTASTDPNQRKRGCKALFKAGMIRIEDDVFIGAGAIVLPYVTIGKGSVVGAGSVVTRDVKPNYVVAGSPAKRIHPSDDLQEQQKKTIKHMERMMARDWREESKHEPLSALLNDPKPPFAA